MLNSSPMGVSEARFFPLRYTDLEKEGVGMTSGKWRAWQMDLFFLLFFGRTHQAGLRLTVTDAVQRTGVLLSSTTSDQIRRILKRLMLEVKVATKSLVHI